MKNLLLAEFRRLLARRITKFFPLVVALLIAVGVTIAYFVMGDEGLVLADSASDPENRGAFLGPLMPLMGFVIGASFIGADIKSGMLEQLFTWEPRRARILLARILGGAVIIFCLVALLLALFAGLLFLLATVKGSTEGIGSEYWLDTLSAIARSGLAAALFYVLGLSISTIVNSSVGAIVGYVIYGFVVENLFVFFLPKIGVWLPLTNSNAWEGAVDVLKDPTDFFSTDANHGYWVAGAVLLAYSAVASIISFVVLQRRDIS